MELLIRPERPRKAYRLRCLMTTGPHPSRGDLERGLKWTMERFVRDMEKQGFGFMGPRTFRLLGPEPHITPHNLPSRAGAEKLDYLPARPVPPLDQADAWDWQLEGVFHAPERIVEYVVEDT